MASPLLPATGSPLLISWSSGNRGSRARRADVRSRRAAVVDLRRSLVSSGRAVVAWSSCMSFVAAVWRAQRTCSCSSFQDNCVLACDGSFGLLVWHIARPRWWHCTSRPAGWSTVWLRVRGVADNRVQWFGIHPEWELRIHTKNKTMFSKRFVEMVMGFWYTLSRQRLGAILMD